MIDMGAISGGLAALSAAKDIAQSLIDLRDTAKFQGAVVELQGKILAAQSDQFTLLETVRELNKKWLRSKHGKRRKAGISSPITVGELLPTL
jgi:hypothetical protein